MPIPSVVVQFPSNGAGGNVTAGNNGQPPTNQSTQQDLRPNVVDEVMATFVESSRRSVGDPAHVDNLLVSLTDTDEPHLLGDAESDETVRKQEPTVSKPIPIPTAELAAAAEPSRSAASQPVDESVGLPWWLPMAIGAGLLAPWTWAYRRRVVNSLSALRHLVGL
ncbi:MAG: hypothetical protein HY288_18580 [Planctomycetia bacterium]|nr:hypothetical protein [Planctomycetia bacterium]